MFIYSNFCILLIGVSMYVHLVLGGVGVGGWGVRLELDGIKFPEDDYETRGVPNTFWFK